MLQTGHVITLTYVTAAQGQNLVPVSPYILFQFQLKFVLLALSAGPRVSIVPSCSKDIFSAFPCTLDQT